VTFAALQESIGCTLRMALSGIFVSMTKDGFAVAVA